MAATGKELVVVLVFKISSSSLWNVLLYGGCQILRLTVVVPAVLDPIHGLLQAFTLLPDWNGREGTRIRSLVRTHYSFGAELLH